MRVERGTKRASLQLVLHNEECDFDQTVSANTLIKIKLTFFFF